MADDTLIEWADATWNPITGCSVVSPGCANCYAMRLAGGRLKAAPSRAGLTLPSRAGPVWTGEVRFNRHWLDQPLRWRRPRRIFVCAHGDLFHEHVPNDWIDQVFAVMALAPQHQFLVQTKRAERVRDYLKLRSPVDGSLSGRIIDAAADMLPSSDIRNLHWDFPQWPLPNVWAGVSVEDQCRADERIPLLLETPAAVRWISAEPLLARLTLDRWIAGPALRKEEGAPSAPGLDWVVAGGESGRGARPMHPAWPRLLRDECAKAGVAFFFKQMNKKDPIPADLLVREFP